METNYYYLVKAKCGHVGKDKFVVMPFVIQAQSKKAAAMLVRMMPRVKHHNKQAILSVEEISRDEYLTQKKLNQNNGYFKAHSIQDQRRLCNEWDLVIHNDAQEEDKMDKFEQLYEKYQLFLYRQRKNGLIKN
jgi:hypothetical protein